MISFELLESSKFPVSSARGDFYPPEYPNPFWCRSTLQILAHPIFQRFRGVFNGKKSFEATFNFPTSQFFSQNYQNQTKVINSIIPINGLKHSLY